MKKVLFISSLIFLFTSCGILSFIRIQDSFSEESVGINNFKQEIPFEIIKGMLVVKMDIQGNERKFILDTGGTTKIDNDFAKELEFTKLGKMKTVDSNNKKSHIKYVKLNEVKIGKIPFHSIVANISDIEILNTISCNKISGIIGVNIMNEAIWQIDYAAQKIVITSSRDSLKLTGEEQVIDFQATGKGVPKIALYINKQYIGDAALDTGFNGDFNLVMDNFPSNAKFIEKEMYTSGAFSTSKDKTKLAKIPFLKMGQSFQKENVVATFSNNLPFGLIGNRFLKDYMVTIDWKSQEILLSPNSDFVENSYRSFGFYPKYEAGKLIVGSIIIDSPAYNKGLRLNDVISKINDVDVSKDVYQMYCDLFIKNEFKKLEKVDLEIIKNDQKIQLVIERFNFLEQL